MAYNDINKDAPAFKHLSKSPINNIGKSPELNSEFYGLRERTKEEWREAKLLKWAKEHKKEFLDKLIKNSVTEESETSILKLHYTRRITGKLINRLAEKEGAIFVLYLAGFKQRQIRKLLRTGTNIVSKAIKMGYKEYYPQISNI
jgi:hypothetical protein